MTNEINGFKIDKFNQYDLPIDQKASTCPKCSEDRKKKKDKCLSIYKETGIARCNHCGEMLQLHTYVKKTSQTPKKVFKKPVQANRTALSDKVLKWFESRGIGQRALNIQKVTSQSDVYFPQVKKKRAAIQFNYFLHNELINTKSRDGEKNFTLESGCELIMYNLDAIRTATECVIVEGEIDSLSFEQCGYSFSTSVPNGFNEKGNINLFYLDNDYYSYFENKEKIYLALDNDKAGRLGQKEFIRRLGAEKCFIVDFKDCKDANEYLIKYGDTELLKTLDDAKMLPIENVETFNSTRNELEDFYINGMQKGYTIGKPDFDDVFSINTKQFVVVTGIPTHGKSDFVDEMVTGYNLKHGLKSLYASPENKPTVLHQDKILRKMVGDKPLNPDGSINYDLFNSALAYLDDNFYFTEYQDGYYLEDILSKAEEMVKRKGIKILVIDPYNKVPTKEEKNRNDVVYYLRTIDNFCRKNDVFTILVAHPTKLKKREGETKEPEASFYDIRGSGDWYDMSYHGLLVYRDKEENKVKIKIMKCKFQHLGQNDAECWYQWNPKNGRYISETNSQGLTDFTPDNSNYLQRLLPKTEKYTQPIETTFAIEQGFTPNDYEGLDAECGF